MKYANSVLSHSIWSSFEQFLHYQCVFALFSITLVNACYSKSQDGSTNRPINGDLTLHVGQTLELFCSLNQTIVNTENITSENLEFVRDNLILDKKYITKLNKTTIRLNIENKAESNHTYRCYLNYPKRSYGISAWNFNQRNSIDNLGIAPNNERNKKLICWNLVEVGTKPKNVENVSCISYNWQELKCTWNVPKNYLKTNYTIQYTPASRTGEVPAKCPNDDDVRNNSCLWTLSTRPMYRKLFETLNIIITGQNKVNKTQQLFIFKQFEHILPQGPTNLQLVNKTSTSMLLKWSIGDMQYFPKPWIYRVLYKTAGSEWTSLIYNSQNYSSHNEMVSCNVTNLTPGTLYNFRVYMKSAIAADKYWSMGYASQIFRTKKFR